MTKETPQQEADRLLQQWKSEGRPTNGSYFTNFPEYRNRNRNHNDQLDKDKPRYFFDDTRPLGDFTLVNDFAEEAFSDLAFMLIVAGAFIAGLACGWLFAGGL